MGVRPPDPDYDPEKDPEYEEALARYVQNNPDSPQAQQQAALPPLVQPTHLPPPVAPAPPVEVAPIPVAPVQPLAGVTSVKEEKDRFLVTQNGQTFPVLKDGLKKDTLAHFEGLAHAFEVVAPGPRGGGKATPLLMASGGEVPDAGFGQTTFLPLAPLGTPDAGVGAPIPFTPGGAIFQGVDPAALAASEAVAAGAPASPGGGVMGALGSAARAVANTLGIGPAVVDALSSEPSKGVTAGTLPPAQRVVPLQQQPPASAPPMASPSLPGVPSQVGELNKGLAEQRAALDAQVQAQREQDLAVVALQDQHIAKLQALEADYQEQAALTQRRADDLFQATLNAQIDPNRVWAQADMGQRVGAGIALILGGIGAGLGGGPNLALQQINRIIDMDVDAQKSNLEKQQTLLAHYLQQGRDMRAAHQLAKADLQDLVAAQMLRVSASFGGDKAAAAAQLAAGQLRTEAAGLRSNMYAQDFQRSVKRLELAQQAKQTAMISQILSGPRTRAGGALWQGEDGKYRPVMPQDLEILPKNDRERAVFLPDGTVGFAPDAERARKLTQGLTTMNALRQTVSEYGALVGGFSPVKPGWMGGTRETADLKRSDIILQLKEMQNLGVLQPYDLKALEPMIPDITAATTLDQTLNQQLGALQQAIATRIDANLRTSLGAR